MKIHFIAIGANVMHALAICLKKKGYQISGSDKEISEPSQSALQKNELLPEKFGWFPEKITDNIDIIILGTHASADNPELLKAKKLNLKIYSYPEYVYQQCKNKQRIVVTGSNGKNTIIAMIMHVLKLQNKKFDYLVNTIPKNFDTNISLTKEAPIIILEGDEHISSVEDQKPKFLHYHHHIALITDLEWNPDYNSYIAVFEKLIMASDKASEIIYYKKNKILSKLIAKFKTLPDVRFISYSAHKNFTKKGRTLITGVPNCKVELEIFGEYDLQNLSASKNICLRLGITEEDFYEAIVSFEYLGLRMEKLSQSKNFHFFRDFSYAPSKVKSALQVVQKQFPRRRLVACFELYIRSNLNKDFIRNYKNTLKSADQAIVFCSSRVALSKQYSVKDICNAFGRNDLKVFNRVNELVNYIKNINLKNTNLLMMSPRNFGGLNIRKLALKLQSKI